MIHMSNENEIIQLKAEIETGISQDDTDKSISIIERVKKIEQLRDYGFADPNVISIPKYRSHIIISHKH